jgi:hypothetical protein
VNATAEVKDHPSIPVSVSDNTLVASVPPTNTPPQPDTSSAPRTATVNLPVQSSSPPKSHSKRKSRFPSAGSPNGSVTVEPPTPLRSDCPTPATEPATSRGRTSDAGAEVPSKRGLRRLHVGTFWKGDGANQMEKLPPRRESTLGRDRRIQSHGGSFFGDWSPRSTASTSTTVNADASTGSGASSLFHAFKRAGTKDSSNTSASRVSSSTVASMRTTCPGFRQPQRSLHELYNKAIGTFQRECPCITHDCEAKTVSTKPSYFRPPLSLGSLP